MGGIAIELRREGKKITTVLDSLKHTRNGAHILKNT